MPRPWLASPTSRAGNTRTCCPIIRPPGAPVNPDDGLWYGPYFGIDYVEILGAHTYPKGHWRVWLERHHPEGLELWKPVNALEPRTGAFHSWKNAIPAEWHYTHRTADRTVDWLRGHAHERPFFLWMSFYDPHQPFTPPRPYCDMYDPADMPPAVPREDVSNKPPQYQYARDGLPYQGYDTTSGWDGDHHGEIVAHYYGMTTFIDDGIARVLQELDRLGLAENTHVIFSSDHGEGLNDHGIAAKPMMSYECVNRVPLLWRHPPTVAAGRVHGGVMTQLDFVPTFLDLAGAEPLVGMEGRSFAPVLRGETDTHRDAVIVERIAIFGSGRPELVGTAKAHAEPIVLRVKMLVTEDWKLLHYGTTDYGELYNVKDDPEDLNNLWDDPAHAAIPVAAGRAPPDRADQRGRRRSAPRHRPPTDRRQPARRAAHGAAAGSKGRSDAASARPVGLGPGCRAAVYVTREPRRSGAETACRCRSGLDNSLEWSPSPHSRPRVRRKMPPRSAAPRSGCCGPLPETGGARFDNFKLPYTKSITGCAVTLRAVSTCSRR